MPSALPAVSLLSKRFAHHSHWSGYGRYTEFLDGLVRARRIAPISRPKALLDIVEKRLGVEGIERDRLGLDLSAARRLVLARGEVVHLLYGDFDHHYAGHFRQLGHMRGNQLLTTIHLPATVLEHERRQWIFKYIDAAVALGNQSAAHISAIIGSRRVFRATHGIDVRAWHPQHSLRATTPLCVLVGSFLRDYEVFENVVRLVAGELPSVRFEVVTGPSHVDTLSAIPNVQARAGILDAELRTLYQSAWVHVLPLVDSVANNALLEGMACGLPTVTTAVGDILDYTRGRGAVCVAPNDPDAMADAVLSLLEDPARRRKLGHAAREAAETHSLEIAARQHADIYSKLSSAAHLRIRRTKPTGRTDPASKTPSHDHQAIGYERRQPIRPQ